MQVWKPHPGQITAMRHAVTRTDGAVGLFLDPGLGKTSTVYGACAILKEHGMFKRALVLAPRRPMLTTWPNERNKWEQFKGFTYATAYGDAKQREAALRADTDMLFSHYDLLASRGKVKGLVEMIEKLADERGEFPFDVLVLDESTKVKNISTSRFKALKAISARFARTFLLSGTPASRGLEDLFGQTFIADDGKRLGRSITRFRREFFIEEWKPYVPVPTWIPQADAEERIFGKLADMALRMDAKDYLQMPGLHFNTVPVQMPADVARTYRQVENDFVSKVEGGVITAANAAGAAMKLRQIASGAVYTDNGTEYLHNAKAEALLDLIEEQAGQPLLVAVAFRSEVEYLRNVLTEAGYGDVPYIVGGIKDADAVRIEREWNEGKHRVVLCHPTTVAHGLNLQAGGNSVCWYSLTWSLEEFIQFNARVWRQGQTASTCIVHMLCAEGTIDERIAAVLADKDATQQRLFQTLKEMNRV